MSTWMNIATASMIVGAALSSQSFLAQSGAAARPSFEVASIKLNTSGDRPGTTWFSPGGLFTATSTTLRALIEIAYQVAPRKGFVTGGSAWLDSDRFDIAAKAEAGAIAAGELDRERVDTMKLMLQTLLDARFNLRLRRETKDLAIYELVAAKGGPKLTKTVEQDCSRPVSLCHRVQGGSGRGIDGHAVEMQDLATFLTSFTDRVVRDRTAIKGYFDIRTTGWSDPTRRPAVGDGVAGRPDEVLDPSGPSVFTVLEEQLGLRLEPSKGPVETLVIDRVDRPSED
jgi:bla regulator protein blaR1